MFEQGYLETCIGPVEMDIESAVTYGCCIHGYFCQTDILEDAMHYLESLSTL